MKLLKNKKLALLVVLFLLSLIGISFYGGPVTYGFFGVVVMIVPVMYLYILCVIFSLKVYQRPDGRSMVCGESADFYITLQNEGWFSFSSLRIIFYSSFSTIIGLEDDIIYELPPHSSVQKRTQLLCRYRGEYKVGIKKIVVQDFLGIFSFTYEIKEPLSVIVAPAIRPLDELHHVIPDPDADQERKMRADRPDLIVREYVPGDELRMLNWKATAVMQKLMVREKTGEEKNKVAILMEAARYGRETEEYLPPENKLIECVLALTLYYMEHGIRTDVIYRTERLCCQTVETVGDFETLYDIMCGYRFREEADTGAQLAEWLEEGGILEYRQVLFALQRWTAKLRELIEDGNIARVPYQVLLVEQKGNKDRSIEKAPSEHRSGGEALPVEGPVREGTEVITIGTEEMPGEVL